MQNSNSVEVKRSEPSNRKLNSVIMSDLKSADEEEDSHVHEEIPTNYFHSIVHLFKGNIGPGLFAMGFAFKNSGLAVGSPLTLLIAVICVHCQHQLIKCSIKMKDIYQLKKYPDFAETVEKCFETSTWSTLSSKAKAMRISVNVFICVTQLGFCCVYFVFISRNIGQILEANGIHMNIRIVMALGLIPIWISSLITNFKWLTPVSGFASICMILSFLFTMYYAVKDGLPSIEEREMYASPSELAVYFGTAIFAFEGIALVLPLKNAMAKPENFDRPLGVLNVGMIFVTALFFSAGFLGYAKWGEDVKGSLTLNLGDTPLAQAVKLMVSLGVLFGYPLQFHIPIQIMLPSVKRMCNVRKRKLLSNLLFRSVLVLVTWAIAEMVPALGLFISLIGSLCSTALALVFPPITELIVSHESETGYRYAITLIKNSIIIFIGLLGFIVGTTQSLIEIITHYS